LAVCIDNKEGTSHANAHEADWIVGLCRYLLQQAYRGNQITVLLTYAEQMFDLRRRIHSKQPSDKTTRTHGALADQMASANDIQVQVLDNYQGEENDIVILSLVRSNKENNIGFLKVLFLSQFLDTNGCFCIPFQLKSYLTRAWE
jgi:superfamily I DNA and/or RNA helicase